MCEITDLTYFTHKSRSLARIFILRTVKMLAANLGCFGEFLKICLADLGIQEAFISESLNAYLERGQFVDYTRSLNLGR
jgi:hypothetical protein